MSKSINLTIITLTSTDFFQFSTTLSDLFGMNIFMKLDMMHYQSGSFMDRGARNVMLQLSDDDKKRGVITASVGNFGIALAHQGKLLGSLPA